AEWDLCPANQLTGLLNPTKLKISNYSWQHRQHAPMKAIGGGDGETRDDAGHQMIYAALEEELETGLHALSLNTKPPSEIAPVPQLREVMAVLNAFGRTS
ncbi:hypothetical protein FRC00_007796, partial [Tulasnella sp. 408]